MIEMNRENVTLAAVLIALASCVYLYKELQKVQRQQQQQTEGDYLRTPRRVVTAVAPQPSQAPVNDVKEPPVVESKKED